LKKEYQTTVTLRCKLGAVKCKWFSYCLQVTKINWYFFLCRRHRFSFTEGYIC